MRPLLLTPEVEAACKALVEKAAADPTPYVKNIELVEARAKGQVINPDNDRFTFTIPRGYQVTYTHEYQREDLICRHISISAVGAKPNTGPNPAAVVEIIRMFGFINSLGHMPTFVNKAPDGSLIIEMLEPLDGDISHLMAPDALHPSRP